MEREPKKTEVAPEASLQEQAEQGDMEAQAELTRTMLDRLKVATASPGKEGIANLYRRIKAIHDDLMIVGPRLPSQESGGELSPRERVEKEEKEKRKILDGLQKELEAVREVIERDLIAVGISPGSAKAQSGFATEKVIALIEGCRNGWPPVDQVAEQVEGEIRRVKQAKPYRHLFRETTGA